jgi:two-component system alkaline phosphatase synthesis response regulator PhoP
MSTETPIKEDSQAMRILLVDDEPDITFIVEFILNSGGFEVTRLNDSTKTIEELKSKKYSLIILDLMMPQQSGFTTLKLIREDDELKSQPVLILSTRQISVEETGFLKQHEAQIMAKPFEPQRLLEKVREILAK